MFKNDVQEKTLVDINKLVSSVLALARIDLQKHKIELQAQLDDRFPKVLSNQVQLQQVILNLVMSAIEAPERALSRPTSPGFFSRCSRPKRVVWEWAFRSANQSLKTMTVGFGYPQGQTGARFSSLHCRWQPARTAETTRTSTDVRYWHLADIALCAAHVCF
ncbi:MAG: hypothetical protein WA679_15705 [Pseudolabrys sp.]